MNSHDVLWWLFIGGKAFCGCSGCFIVVHCWSHPCSQYFPCSSFHALSPAQAQGPCLHARVLPRGDSFMRAREGVQNIALPALLERVCAAPAYHLLEMINLQKHFHEALPFL